MQLLEYQRNMKKKVLLIDDSQDVRENVAEILTLSDYEVITSENGKDGVEVAQKILPDIIVCDISMPLLDGFGVVHLLARSPETAKIPIILLTARNDRDSFRKGMELGADDFITKPFEEAELLRAIEVRLKKHDENGIHRNGSGDGFLALMNDGKSLENFRETAGDGTIFEFQKREYVYREGGQPRYVYFIESGKVKTVLLSNDGKELMTALYGEGDIFGHIAMLEEAEYTESAIAVEPLKLHALNKADFFSLLGTHQGASAKFIRIMADQLVETEDKLLRLAYDSVRKRVAEALVDVYRTYTLSNGNKEIEISRQELASYVGTATETVIRTLSAFKQEGLINIVHSNIIIKDLAGLIRMKN